MGLERMTISDTPLVSVVITTYKRPNLLKRAIDSALLQTYPNIEVVVVDDNNPDTEFREETQTIMQEFNPLTNVKYIKHSKNLNGAAARNTGINNSSGEIIAFLDDDDWYLKTKISKQVQYLLEHPEYDAVYCGWERDNKDWLFTKEGNLTYEVLKGTNPVITNTIVMKKEAAIRCGGWDERFKRNQEPVFLLRFFKHGYKIGVVKEVLVKFDISDRSNVFDAKSNEENINFFLDVHKDQINQCELLFHGAKKGILCNRYTGVFLNYLKNKDYKGAISFYLKVMKLYPLTFNYNLYLYIKEKKN